MKHDAYLQDVRDKIDEARKRASEVVLVDEIVGLENPYFDTFVSLCEEPYGSWGMYNEAAMYARRGLVTYYAWAVPDEAALKLIGGPGSVVEIGAGGGYWAALLRARGVEVFPYDPKPGINVQSNRTWTDVQVGWTRPAGEHPESTLFLCWPAYTSRYAEIALRRYLRAGGTRVAYVGEDEYGCCAEERFFGLLQQHFEQVGESSIPQYPGIHDYLTIWERRA